MHKYTNTSQLAFPAKELYKIVIDVESYPIFLPWCMSAKVINKKSKNSFDASLKVGYKAIDEEYTSRVMGTEYKEIKSSAINGPFNYLESIWKFKSLDNDYCEVQFNIEYKFKSFFLDKIMGGLFKKATIKMLDAFEKRANELNNRI